MPSRPISANRGLKTTSATRSNSRNGAIWTSMCRRTRLRASARRASERFTPDRPKLCIPYSYTRRRIISLDGAKRLRLLSNCHINVMQRYYVNYIAIPRTGSRAQRLGETLKLKKLAHLIALIGVVGPAVAQDVQTRRSPIQRVEITGSSIKRIAKEGALPVQIITLRPACDKQGITNAEQLIAPDLGQRHRRRQHDLRQQRVRRRRRPRQRRRLVRLAARPGPEQHPGAAERPPHRRPTACPARRST